MIYLIAASYGTVYVGYVQNLEQIEKGWNLTLIDKDNFHFIDSIFSNSFVPYTANGCYWRLLE